MGVGLGARRDTDTVPEFVWAGQEKKGKGGVAGELIRSSFVPVNLVRFERVNLVMCLPHASQCRCVSAQFARQEQEVILEDMSTVLKSITVMAEEMKSEIQDQNVLLKQTNNQMDEVNSKSQIVCCFFSLFFPNPYISSTFLEGSPSLLCRLFGSVDLMMQVSNSNDNK